MRSRCDQLLVALALTAAAALPGCRQDMHDQPRVDPYEEHPLRPGETANLLPVPGTVARDSAEADALRDAAGKDGQLATTVPLPVDLALLQRGRERYDIYCVPCHGLTGRGDGPVIERGFFPRIASLQAKRLRDAADGHLFGVITNGFDAMPDYAAEIAPRDRWAIVAYVRALQYSRHAPRGAVPAAERESLEKEGRP